MSGTSARHATARDPARIAFARSLLGGAFDVMPLLPPCVCTSIEIDLRSTASAADAPSAVLAAVGGSPRPIPPAPVVPPAGRSAIPIPGFSVAPANGRHH